jgi:RNA polymerase sigma factor (sigma-70 family)
VTSEHLSDQGLIALVARGDRDALAALYDRYGGPAYALARRITRSAELAEDVVQEVFLAVWRQARTFDARRARPSTWLLALTHHKAVDAVRREDVRRASPLEEAPEPVADSDAAREAWLSLQRRAVLECLAQLSDPQREVIELCYFEGYTQSQLAVRLGQPLGTIKSRTHTALARLRDVMQARGITTEDPWSIESSRS